MRPQLSTCSWFWTWSLVGAGVGFSFVSFLGVLTVVPVVVVAVLLSRLHRVDEFGLLSGIGAMLLVVAYINRHGDGLNPIPWLAVGLVLFGAGVLGRALDRR